MGKKQKLRRERKIANRASRSAVRDATSLKAPSLGRAGQTGSSIYSTDKRYLTCFDGQYHSTSARLTGSPRESKLGTVPIAVDIAFASQQLASEAVQLSIRGAAPPPVCGVGCSWCCHYDVRVPEVEVVAIAHALKTAMAGEALNELNKRIDAVVAAGVGDMTADERAAARIPCPLLDPTSGGCTIYEVRPVACRQMLSEDAELCRKSLDGEPSLHSFGAEGILGSAISLATQAALFDAGYPSGTIELATGLQRALAHGAPASAWENAESAVEAQPTFRDDGSLGPMFEDALTATKKLLSRAGRA